MSTNPSNSKLQEQESRNSLNVTDIIGICLSNWYWFVICLCISCAGAVIYLRMTPPVFTRNTSIVIKEDANSKAVDDVFLRMRGNGVRQGNASLKNEIIAFQKPALMRKVVERLNLDFQYEIRGRLRNTVLYGSSLPIKVSVDGIGNNTNVEFVVTINDDNRATLKFTDQNGKTTKLQARFGKKFKSPLGTTTIEKTRSFGARSIDPITVTRTGYDAVTGQILSRMAISNTDEESTVIDISLSDVNIERADDILNTLIAIYNETWVTNRNQVIVATNNFINKRLEAIKQELGEVENEMTQYKMANHTIDFENEGMKYQSRSLEFDNQNLEISKELSLVMYFRGVVKKATDPTVTLPLPAGVHNNSLSEQVGQYNALVLNRSNLISSSTKENPLVGDVDKQMAVLHNGILTTIENHISTLNSQLGVLNISTSRNNAEIDAAPLKQKNYIDIERRRKIKDQLYTFLLQTREQNELNQAFAAYNTQVLQPSTGSKYQSFPDVKRIWTIAIVLGLAIPFLFFILREWSNSKVRGRRDIEHLTIPFVGELPNVEFPDEEKVSKLKKFMSNIFKKKKKSRHRHQRNKDEKDNYVERVVVEHGNRNVINEAYRVLRTNLEFMLGNNPEMKVIMTTSANPHSGKTFITYNLAKCMSLKGKKVCAIDLDLRRRSLSKYVEKPELGVSDYINGAVSDWHELVVQAPDAENLYILPVGTLPPNPAEIISYDRFGEMIAEIRKEFDYVFFDCPPVEIVADTSILSKYADVTLFVIRVGIMEIEFLDSIEDYYRNQKFNNMGLILNGTLTANSRYGYSRYGYRYGYGYGYGYGGYGYGNSYDEGYSK